MEVIPFGNVIEARMELSKKYQLIQNRGVVWVLTDKCRKHYDPISYIEYLRGKRDTPLKKSEVKTKTEDIFKDF